MLSHPSSIALPNRPLNRLAGLIRTHRPQHRSHWRRLNPGQQALLALAHLRNGDPFTRLATGIGAGTATARRSDHPGQRRSRRPGYGHDPDAPAGLRDPRGDPDPDRPRRRSEAVLLRETQRHGVDVQVIVDPAGRLVWASPALPGGDRSPARATLASIL